jgi:hypothetical protein
VVPVAWISRTMPSSCSTMVGARPRDSSSIMSSFGRAMKAWPRASICCSPPERLPAIWSSARAGSGRARATSRWPPRRRSGSLRNSQPASRRFSATVSVGNTPLPPGTSDDAQGGGVGASSVGDVLAVEDDGAPLGVDQAGDGLEQGGLAGAVGAEQGHDLAAGARRGVRRLRRGVGPLAAATYELIGLLPLGRGRSVRWSTVRC